MEMAGDQTKTNLNIDIQMTLIAMSVKDCKYY